MNLRSVARIVGIAASAGTGVAACQGSDVAAPEAEVLARTNDLAAAWIDLDPDRYLAYFAEDLVFYFEGQRMGRDVFDAGVRTSMGALHSSTFEVLDPHVQALGADAAVVSFGLRELMVDTTGATTDLRAAFTLVWSRKPEGWRVSVAHESLPLPD